MMTSTPSPTTSCTDTPVIRACGAIAFAASAPSPLMGEGRGGGEFAARCPNGSPPARCDPQLGPVLLFGSGGVMVEVYNDVALRRCPITRSEAQAMIAEVKGARLLQ